MEIQYLDFNKIETLKTLMKSNNRIYKLEDSEENFDTLIGNSNVYYILKKTKIIAYLILCEGYIIADLFSSNEDTRNRDMDELIKYVQKKYDELHYQMENDSFITKKQLIDKGFAEDEDQTGYYIWEK